MVISRAPMPLQGPIENRVASQFQGGRNISHDKTGEGYQSRQNRRGVPVTHGPIPYHTTIPDHHIRPYHTRPQQKPYPDRTHTKSCLLKDPTTKDEVTQFLFRPYLDHFQTLHKPNPDLNHTHTQTYLWCECGVVWCGVVCGECDCGLVWCGVVWRGVAWCGVVW